MQVLPTATPPITMKCTNMAPRHPHLITPDLLQCLRRQRFPCCRSVTFPLISACPTQTPRHSYLSLPLLLQCLRQLLPWRSSVVCPLTLALPTRSLRRHSHLKSLRLLQCLWQLFPWCSSVACLSVPAFQARLPRRSPLLNSPHLLQRLRQLDSSVVYLLSSTRLPSRHPLLNSPHLLQCLRQLISWCSSAVCHQTSARPPTSCLSLSRRNHRRYPGAYTISSVPFLSRSHSRHLLIMQARNAFTQSPCPPRHLQSRQIAWSTLNRQRSSTCHFSSRIR